MKQSTDGSGTDGSQTDGSGPDGGGPDGSMADGSVADGSVADGSVADGRTGGNTFVESLPDLIDGSEYADYPDGRLVRLQITVTESGVEIIGDAFRPAVLEALLADLGGGPTEQMLCG
nr:radical SAM-modified peptide, FtsH ternary system-associated [Frankia sp. Cas3]